MKENDRLNPPMGAVVLAGGMGTRLGFPHPKGCLPFSPVTHKSLFQGLAEKCLAASEAFGKKARIAFMVSPENEKETKAFFQKHGQFGLASDQLFFFVQEHLPFLTQEKEPLKETGPAGNGSFFKDFNSSGLLQAWENLGIYDINVIPIDNPLADPYDRRLFSHHSAQKNDATLKCIARRNPEEKVGIIVEEKGNYRVVEYSEASEEMKNTRDETGNLLYPLANLSLFCFSLSFIKRLQEIPLPYHFALKRLSNSPQAPWVYKRETFIFDCLPHAQKVSALIYPREDIFAPIKESSGQDSPETARQRVYDFEARLYEKATKKKAPPYPFEAPPSLYYIV